MKQKPFSKVYSSPNTNGVACRKERRLKEIPVGTPVQGSVWVRWGGVSVIRPPGRGKAHVGKPHPAVPLRRTLTQPCWILQDSPPVSTGGGHSQLGLRTILGFRAIFLIFFTMTHSRKTFYFVNQEDTNQHIIGQKFHNTAVTLTTWDELIYQFYSCPLLSIKEKCDPLHWFHNRLMGETSVLKTMAQWSARGMGAGTPFQGPCSEGSCTSPNLQTLLDHRRVWCKSFSRILTRKLQGEVFTSIPKLLYYK